MKGPLIFEALRDKGVTILPAVPKMVALFYDGIMHNVKKKSAVAKTIFGGMKTISATTGNFIGNDIRRAMFSGVHKKFGGKLRMVISGGAALGKKYWTGFRLLGFEILEGYGLSETFGPITLSPRDNPQLGSVGLPLGNNELKIVNQNEHGIGEVCFRGDCVFKQYYKNEKLTSEVFDSEGWFHTGDLGKIDKNGHLYLSGRKKDMIVLDNGKNVYPDELEDFYGESELIEELGIFGVIKDNHEIVAATIVPSKEIRAEKTIKEATDMIYDELVRLGKTLPVYRRINDFVILFTPLPRTTTRKLKKQELIKMYNSIRRKSANRLNPDDQLSVIEMAIMETEEYVGIVSGITQVSQKIDPRIINLRSHLEIDLGLDSLMLIELLSYIENRFSITINDEVFDKMETIGDLVSLIREQKAENEKTSVDRVMGLKERILAYNVDDYRVDQKLNPVAKVAGSALQKIASGFSSVNSYGEEFLFQKDTPLIFASNHNNPLDAFWILSALPDSIRANTIFPGDYEGQKYPLVPYSVYSQNVIRLQRYSDPIEALKFSLSILRKNKNLIVFPEGNVSEPGLIGQFKSGIGLLSKETDAAIVPVKIAGPMHLKSDNPRYNIRKKTIIFGAPVTVSELIASGKCVPNCTADDIAQYIRSIIVKL
ncbi:MAG: AMP-binding protein, partial [Fibrobacter sp.]|nr:AMP-binding protein [Fibrobacter sp.]